MQWGSETTTLVLSQNSTPSDFSSSQWAPLLEDCTNQITTLKIKRQTRDLLEYRPNQNSYKREEKHNHLSILEKFTYHEWFYLEADNLITIFVSIKMKSCMYTIKHNN